MTPDGASAAQIDPTITDIEIEAQTVRYARAAAPGRRAADILVDLQRDFPSADVQRIRRCMGRAAVRLDDQHH